jgi:hypothetical protein
VSICAEVVDLQFSASPTNITETQLLGENRIVLFSILKLFVASKGCMQTPNFVNIQHHRFSSSSDRPNANNFELHGATLRKREAGDSDRQLN